VAAATTHSVHTEHAAGSADAVAQLQRTAMGRLNSHSRHTTHTPAQRTQRTAAISCLQLSSVQGTPSRCRMSGLVVKPHSVPVGAHLRSQQTRRASAHTARAMRRAVDKTHTHTHTQGRLRACGIGCRTAHTPKAHAPLPLRDVCRVQEQAQRAALLCARP
jgi:hypothetical protein